MTTTHDHVLRSHERSTSQRLAHGAGHVIGKALCSMGPGYVKAGQLLSTRKDLMPAEICNGLSAAVVGARARRGSIAQVDRRVDENGRPYAAKSLRPGIDARLRSNLRTMILLANTASRIPAFRDVPVKNIVEDIAASIGRQTDLVAEKQSLERLRAALDRLEVTVPAPLPAKCNDSLLAMDWIVSDPRIAVEALDARERERVLTLLVRSLLRMIFVDGFFHCDLHPGNWWPLEDGTIAVVDAGFTHELPTKARWHFIEFFYGMAFGDGEHAYQHMLATAHPDLRLSPEVLASLRRETIALVEAQYDSSVSDFDLARFGAQLFQVQRRHKFRGDTSFIFPLIALLTIEGQLKEHAPTLDFQALSRQELGRPLLKLRAEFALGKPRVYSPGN